MRFFGFASLALLVAPAFAGPVALKSIETYAGETKPGSYIVTLNPDVSKSSFIADLLKRLGPDDKITHGEWDSKVLNGFAANLSPTGLDLLRDFFGVNSIQEDGILTTQATTVRQESPWGLQRISQRARLASTNPTTLTYNYTYDDAAGRGVDIYVIDTGIYTEHVQFGGRARWGMTFGGYQSQDGNGHGTHVAGTAGGSHYGVASQAMLVAVKVLDDGGSGTTSDIISGINWVVNQVGISRRPSVINMSLGGVANDALDTAVRGATSSGVHVAVAAGNDGLLAGSYSPARAPSANTVGASTISDARASFSNFGPELDVFAPGQDITSAWIGSPMATNTISGTSMASPHVAGLIAYLISVEGNKSPAEMTSRIQGLSTKNALSGVPSGPFINTKNYLAYNGIV